MESEISYKTAIFLLYLRPSNNSGQLIFKHKCCCFNSDNLRYTKMVKCLPEFEYFAVFLKIETLFLKLEDQTLQTMQL